MDLEAPDVVVVGLGPAGSCAAAVAARAGLAVIAVERRPQAGTPVQCAEFVPLMIEGDVSGLSTATCQMVRRMRTFVERGEPEEVAHFPGRMIERTIFDDMLARDAALGGATCLYGTALRRIEADGTLRLSDGSAWRPRLLIGADGPRSCVGAAIGQVNRDLVDARQVTVPLADPHDATDIFLRAEYRGGYGWLFPKGAVANVGIGVSIEERGRLKSLLASLHAELAGLRRVGATATGLTGGAIPVGGRLAAVGKVGATPVLLAGDAAGLTNPVTGAGIASAVQSGMLAGRAAAEMIGGRNEALNEYDEELGDLFDAALTRARRRRLELLGQYECGGPRAPALRSGWIASPDYWAA